MVTLNFVCNLSIESTDPFFVAGFICPRDMTENPPKLLQQLLLAFRFAAEVPCRRNIEWCRKRFPCRWRRLFYTKAKKKGANGFLVKDIHVSGLTGSEYCWRAHNLFCIVCKWCWFLLWFTFELDVSSSCETINLDVNDLFIPMFYINQRVCWNNKESGAGLRSLTDAVVTYFRVHGSEDYRKTQLSCWLPHHSLSD
jgi:hypothetical protein